MARLKCASKEREKNTRKNLPKYIERSTPPRCPHLGLIIGIVRALSWILDSGTTVRDEVSLQNTYTSYTFAPRRYPPRRTFLFRGRANNISGISADVHTTLGKYSIGCETSAEYEIGRNISLPNKYRKASGRTRAKMTNWTRARRRKKCPRMTQSSSRIYEHASQLTHTDRLKWISDSEVNILEEPFIIFPPNGSQNNARTTM